MPDKNDLNQLSELVELFRPEKIFMLVLAFCLLIFIARKLKNFSTNLQVRYPNLRLAILQVSTIITFTWYIAGTFLVVYGVLQPGKEILLAIGGSAAVAIGFALKDIVASLISGIVLLFDRPFQVGDRVSFQDIYGEISHIGLRAVRLVTLDDSLVTIPNSQFINNAVSSGNAGALDMLIESKFLVDIDSNIELVKSTLREIVVTSRFAYLKKPVNVIVSEKVVSNLICLEFNVKAYVFDVHHEKAFSSDIFTRGNTRLRELEVQRPRPIAALPG